jgi:hypothetical protein
VERRSLEAKARVQSDALRAARREHKAQLKALEDAHAEAQGLLFEKVRGTRNPTSRLGMASSWPLCAQHGPTFAVVCPAESRVSLP